MAKLEIPSIVVHNNTCETGTSCLERPRISPFAKCRLSKQAEFEEADEECDAVATSGAAAMTMTTTTTTSSMTAEPIDEGGGGGDGDGDGGGCIAVAAEEVTQSATPPLPLMPKATATVASEDGDLRPKSSPTSPSPTSNHNGTGVRRAVTASASAGAVLQTTKKAASVDGSGVGNCVSGSSSSGSGVGQLKVRSESTSALPRQRSKDRTKGDNYFSHPKVKLLQRSQAVRGDDDASPPDLSSAPDDVGCGCSTEASSLSVISSQAVKMTSSKHQRLGKQGSSGGSIDSNSSVLSRDSSLEQYTDSTGVDLQQFIVDTLHKNQKDRLLLLKIEQELISLVKDAKRQHFRFPQMSAYQRMFVHRVAAFFGLDHNIDQIGTAVIVNKTKNTRLPEMRFRDQIRDELMPDEPKKSILKRDSSSLEDYKDLKSPERQLSSDGGGCCSDRRSKSFEEREEEYGKSSSSQEGAIDSPFSRSHDGTHNSSRRSSQEDLRWLSEPRPWSSTDSDSSNRPCDGSKRLVITKTSASTDSEPSGSSSGGHHHHHHHHQQQQQQQHRRFGAGLVHAKSDSSESERLTTGGVSSCGSSGGSSSNKDPFLHPSTPSSRRANSRAVPKASSFGGISVLVRADSAASTKSAGPRLSKTESLGSSSIGTCSSASIRGSTPSGTREEEQEDDTHRDVCGDVMVASAVEGLAVEKLDSKESTVGMANVPSSAVRPTTIGTQMQPPPSLLQGIQGPPWIVPQQGQPVMWAVSNVESVPPGSILINPQTGQPFLNTDGTLYRHNPPPPLPPSSSSASPSSATTIKPIIQVNPYHHQMAAGHQATSVTTSMGFGGTSQAQSQSPFVLCGSTSSTTATSPPQQQQPPPSFDQRSFVMQEQSPTATAAAATDLMTSHLSALSFASGTSVPHMQQQQAPPDCLDQVLLQQPHQQHPSSNQGTSYGAVIPRASQHQPAASSLYFPVSALQSPLSQSRYVHQMPSYPANPQQPQLTPLHPTLQGITAVFVDGQPPLPPPLPPPTTSHTPQPFHQMQSYVHPAIFTAGPYGQQQQQQQQQPHLQMQPPPLPTEMNYLYSSAAASPHIISSGTSNFSFPTYAYTTAMIGGGGNGSSALPPPSTVAAILNNPSQQQSHHVSGGMSFFPSQGQTPQHQTVFRPQTPPGNQSQSHGLAANASTVTANQGRCYTIAAAANPCSVPPSPGTFALYASQRLPSQNVQVPPPPTPSMRGGSVPSGSTRLDSGGPQQQFPVSAALIQPPPPPLPGPAFVATALPIFRMPNVQPNTPPLQQQQPSSQSSQSRNAGMQPVPSYVMPGHRLLSKAAAAAAAGYGMPVVDQRFVKSSAADVTYIVDASGGVLNGQGVVSTNPLVSANGMPRTSAQVYGRGFPVVQGDFRLIGMPLQQNPHRMQATLRMPFLIQPQQHRSMTPSRFHQSNQQPQQPQSSLSTAYCSGLAMASRTPKLRRQRSKGGGGSSGGPPAQSSSMVVTPAAKADVTSSVSSPPPPLQPLLPPGDFENSDTSCHPASHS